MKKGLSAKDLINVGIYTAIYLVLFFVIGMMNAIPILYPAIYLLIPIVTGIPFMLFLTKIEKFGMVTIMSIIIGVFWYFMGYTWLALVGCYWILAIFLWNDRLSNANVGNGRYLYGRC